MRLLMLGMALLASGEAAAQFAPGGATPTRSGGWSHPVDSAPRMPDVYRNDERALFARDIRDARNAGQLTRREARQLRREAGVIDSLTQRYARDGLSAAERRELDLRAGVLRDRLNRGRVK